MVDNESAQHGTASEKQRLVEGRSCDTLSIESMETRESLILQNPDMLQLYRRAVCLVQADDENGSENVVRGTKLKNWKLFATATSNPKTVVCKFCDKVICSDRKERGILLELYWNHEKLMNEILSGMISGSTDATFRMIKNDHCTLVDDGSSSVICNWCDVKFGLETNSAAPCIDNHLALEHCVTLDNDLKSQLSKICWRMFMVGCDTAGFVKCTLCNAKVVSPSCSDNTNAMVDHLKEQHLDEFDLSKLPISSEFALTSRNDQGSCTTLKCAACGSETVALGRLFECSHYYCTDCEAKNATDNATFCSQCENDRSVDRYSDQHRTTGESEISLTCVVCDNVASGFCDSCVDFLCDRCAEAHGFVKFTREHQVTPIAKLSPKNTCSVHRYPAVVVCMDCVVLLCKDCNTDDHTGHCTIAVSDSWLVLDAEDAELKLEMEDIRNFLKAFRMHCEKAESTIRVHGVLRLKRLRDLKSSFVKLVENYICSREQVWSENIDSWQKVVLHQINQVKTANLVFQTLISRKTGFLQGNHLKRLETTCIAEDTIRGINTLIAASEFDPQIVNFNCAIDKVWQAVYSCLCVSVR